MKKIIFLLALTFSAVSYGQVSVGLNGGYLIAANSYDANVPSPHVGFKTGAEVLITVSERWQIRTGLEYNSFKFRSQYQYTDGAGNKKGFVNEYHTAGYLGVPVAARFQFKGTKLNPFIEGGFTGLFKVSDKSFTDGPAGFGTLNMKANSFILSPTIGAGLTYHPTDHLYLSFLLNYNLQLMTIYNYKDIKFNSIGTVLSLGYKF